MKLYDVAPLPGYHPEIGILLAALQDSTREWRENLGDVPDEVIGWQPVPESYNLGTLILHLVDAEDHWFHTVIAGFERDPAEVKLFLSDELDQYEGRWPIPHAQPLSWYLELHDRIRARSLESLKGAEPTRQIERPGRGYGVTVRWIIAHVLEHDSYTGGQAVELHEMWKKVNGR